MSPTPTAEEIVKPYEDNPSIVQQISKRRVPVPIAIVAPNPSWPSHFSEVKSIITKALDPSIVLKVSHVGSTSVPNLPAKNIIDIDLTLSNPSDESCYIPALEVAGFQFILREPEWYEHRFLVLSDPYHVNLHVFAPGTAELIRHEIMRDWLKENEDDRQAYAKVKMEAAEASHAAGETQMQYNARKQDVIREILEKAFKAKGLLPQKVE